MSERSESILCRTPNELKSVPKCFGKMRKGIHTGKYHFWDCRCWCRVVQVERCFRSRGQYICMKYLRQGALGIQPRTTLHCPCIMCLRKTTQFGILKEPTTQNRSIYQCLHTLLGDCRWAEWSGNADQWARKTENVKSQQIELSFQFTFPMLSRDSKRCTVTDSAE